MIQGYEKVLHCDQWSEIYYYYGIDLDNEDTLRFEIFYSKDLEYENLSGEESDSRTIGEDGCTPGLMGE